MQAITNSRVLRQFLSMYDLVTDKCSFLHNLSYQAFLIANTKLYLNVVSSLFMGLFPFPVASMENSHSFQWNRTRQYCVLEDLHYIQILS